MKYEILQQAAEYFAKSKEWQKAFDLAFHAQLGTINEQQAEIDALKVQNAELLAAQEWRDIESAPKDEESVLILFGEADVVVVAHWDGDNECWCESWLGDELTNGHAKKWRPLPLPPAIAKALGES